MLHHVRTIDGLRHFDLEYFRVEMHFALNGQSWLKVTEQIFVVDVVAAVVVNRFTQLIREISEIEIIVGALLNRPPFILYLLLNLDKNSECNFGTTQHYRISFASQCLRHKIMMLHQENSLHLSWADARLFMKDAVNEAIIYRIQLWMSPLIICLK